MWYCSATSNLKAQKNYDQLQLNWDPVYSVSTYQYGGYYNYYDTYGNQKSGNFGSTTGGTQITITIPPSTYSLTYRVVSNCPDGSTTESLAASFNF
jgi:hypothetical protein